jgi:large-conductance mechanosensitive channel
MAMTIAVGHLIGSVIALILVGFATLMVTAWETERNKKKLIQEASVQLGIRAADFDNEEMTPRIIKFAADRYSNELFKNRLSDLGGFILIGWGWLGTLIQAGVLIGVAWTAFTDDLGTAVYAWTIIPIALVFWIIGICFSFFVLLLTNRYPGQARQARKHLMKLAESQESTLVESE